MQHLPICNLGLVDGHLQATVCLLFFSENLNKKSCACIYNLAYLVRSKRRNQITSGGNGFASGKVEEIPNGKYVPSKGVPIT